MIETKEKREIRKKESEKYLFTYRKYCQAIQRYITYFKQEKFDYIIAVYAGGLPLGTHLKNLLDIPLVVIYPKEKNHTIYLPEGKRCLVVDDINDSGGTFEDVVNQINNQSSRIMNIDTFALLEKPDSSFKCDYVGYEYKEDAWVEFHWEIL